VAIDTGVVGRCPSWLVDLLHVHHGVSIVLGFHELVVRSTASRRRLTNTITTNRHPERIYHIARCNAVHDLYTRQQLPIECPIVFCTIAIYLAKPCRRQAGIWSLSFDSLRFHNHVIDCVRFNVPQTHYRSYRGRFLRVR